MAITSLSPLSKSLLVSTKGIVAQNARQLAISQNLANADTRAVTPDGPAYRRKLVSYVNKRDSKFGVDLVKVRSVQYDQSPFKMVYDPSDPAANKEGYVAQSNVKPLIELADMREAGLTHEGCLRAYEYALGSMKSTIELLRG